MDSSKWIKVIPYADILLGWFFLMITVRNEKPDVVLFSTEEAEAAGGSLAMYIVSTRGPVIRVYICGM